MFSCAIVSLLRSHVEFLDPRRQHFITQKSTDIGVIQDYFGKTIAPVKRVFLTYGPSGKSLGVATIIFADPAAGPKAAKQLDGVKVDNRAMKVSHKSASTYV